MPINISEYQIELLDKYLDGQLSGEEYKEVKHKVSTDPSWKEGLELLLVSRDAIRSRGLSQMIKGLHRDIMEEIKHPPEARVVSLRPSVWQWTARIAASVLVLVLVLGTYQFATVRSEELYQEKFVEYYLPVTRGVENQLTIMDSLYVNEDFVGVTREFGSLTDKAPRSLFLTAMSYFQLDQNDQAMKLLSDLKEVNAGLEKPYFTQEIDYYLALTFIKAHQYDQAISLFEEIRNNPKHLYHHNVSGADIWKLRLLDIKE